MKTIIAPTDFSPVSLNAVNYAADMAQDINVELILMHTDNFFISTSEVFLEPTITYAETYGAEQLEELRQKLIKRTNNKLNIRTQNIKGIVFNEIENICEREHPFAVVMATHSPSVMERWVMQSVTLFAVKHVKFPILIIPETVTYCGIKTVALACDLKSIYQEPLEVLRNLISTFHASLQVLHVVKPGEDKRFAEMMLTRHYLYEFEPELHFLENEDIEQAVFEFAKDNAVDILMILSKKHELLEKSELKKFVLHSEVPLMALQPQLD